MPLSAILCIAWACVDQKGVSRMFLFSGASFKMSIRLRALTITQGIKKSLDNLVAFLKQAKDQAYVNATCSPASACLACLFWLSWRLPASHSVYHLFAVLT